MNEIRGKQKSLAVNAVLNTIKTVLGMLLSLVTFPYVSRVLDVKLLGAYNFSASIVSYALLIAGLGITSYSIREGSQYRDDKVKMEHFASEMFSINILSTALSYLFLFVCAFLIPRFAEYRLMILILSIEVVCTTIGVTWIGNIYEDFLYITIRTLGFQILYLASIFIFVKEPNDIYKYVIITTITTSGSNILNYFYLRRKYVRFRFTLKIDWKRHLKPILVIFSTKIAITIYVNSDKTILGLLTNDYEVGLYSAAVKIYSIIKDMLVAVVTVLIPRFSLMLRRESKESTDIFFSKVLSTMSLMILPAMIGLFIMSREIMIVTAGSAYALSAIPLRILSVATAFSMYANIYTTCILVPGKKETVVFWATIISALVNVGLNYILIPMWGMNAAALTTVIAEVITFIIAYINSKPFVSLRGIKKNMISIALSCIGIVVFCGVCKYCINNIYINLFSAIIGSVIIYAVLLILTGNSTARDFFAVVKNKVKHG